MIGRYPEVRLRRLRINQSIRDLVSEITLSPSDLIAPIFVQEGTSSSTPIPSLPSQHRLTIDLLKEHAKKIHALGIPAVALFPAVEEAKKTLDAREATNRDNLICRSIKAIKDTVPNLLVIGDVALDPYTSHGQDGLVEHDYVVNDKTIDILCKQAVTLAAAGCDIVAPSDMMDGRIRKIRQALEQEAYHNTLILSYTAKYASNLYGPFRDAIGSTAQLGKADKKTYQMDPRNAKEAVREALLDIDEGADMIMVKPALPYLDIIQTLSKVTDIPVCAYQVSGEYAMIKAASEQGWLNFKNVLLEMLVSCKRAGARSIFTYGALEAAEHLNHH